MREGRFREDLHHRLYVLRLYIPALRARGQDLQTLAQRPPRESRGDIARHIPGVLACAIDGLCRHACRRTMA
ncbi:sigma-54-dependent Fis family transcriptional regulator, partial [Burkholderia thailandensis]|nr:sigma-54-dependent Fis family transcriptional regulator [Burkholderia thailandensis]